nr:hypothetical protein HK105_001282 [Polyrhizophydium stewartii]
MVAPACPAYEHGGHADPRLRESLPWLVGAAVGGALMVSTVALSLHLTFRHLQNYTRPPLQRPITRILLMVPLYSICSWLSFVTIEWATYISVVRDCYEGFVVYNFFILCLEYLGPNEASRERALANKPLMQYVFVRVATTSAAVVMEVAKVYCPESMSPHFGHMYTTIANAVSVGLAMFTLISFYLPIRGDISQFRPVGQFLSIKFVIFFQFWLGIAIKLMVSNGLVRSNGVWTVEQFSMLLQNFIINLEMMIAAILHVWAFDYTPFRTLTGEPMPITIGLWDSFYWLDLWHDMIYIGRFVAQRLGLVRDSQHVLLPGDDNEHDGYDDENGGDTDEEPPEAGTQGGRSRTASGAPSATLPFVITDTARSSEQ